MTVNFEYQNLILRVWLLMHRAYISLKSCEDQIYGEKGLTTEQYTVLASIKYLNEPVKVTDVAQWIGRRTNSVSMMADRMVKAGLLRRLRDRADRRAVRLVITSKGEDALKSATLVGWEFIQKIMLPLSHEDQHTFARLLERMRYETLKYLNPGEDIEEMIRNETKQHANLMERLFLHALPSTPEPKRQGGKKGKTIRRG
jgi:DNA-binding MarR family transcriptional regulator